MLKRFLTYNLITLLIFGAIAEMPSLLAATKEAPKMDNVTVEVSPRIQGVNGTQIVKASVQINGTC